MKYILITGASGDIGSACAFSLAEAGYSIYCHYHSNQKKIETLLKKLQINYPTQDFFMVQADLSQDNSVDFLLNTIFQLDGIIFAHGRTSYNLLTNHSNTDFDNMWRTHLKTPMLLCQKLQSKLSISKHGRIIFISSVYGLIGSPMEVLYSTLKGGQIAFTNAYAKEIATLGITINTIAPGAVDTSMNKNWSLEEKEELLEEIPLQRMASPEEIASLVLFLLSNNAAYITGTSIPVTGGWKI